MGMAALVFAMAVFAANGTFARSLSTPINMRQTKTLTLCVGEQAALHIFNSEKERKNHTLKVNHSKVLQAVEKRNAGSGTDAVIKGMKAGRTKVVVSIKKSGKSVKKVTMTVKVRKHSFDKQGKCIHCGQKKKNNGVSNGGKQTGNSQAPLIEEISIPQSQQGGNEGTSVFTSNTTVSPTAGNSATKFSGLRNKYPEGMPWGDEQFYMIKGNRSLPVDENGLRLGNLWACAAFAFRLNDEVFGTGNYYQHNNVNKKQVGDVIHLNHSHWVIVTNKSDAGFTVAEGNMNRAVHWDRFISRDEMQSQMNIVNTKYPQ